EVAAVAYREARSPGPRNFGLESARCPEGSGRRGRPPGRAAPRPLLRIWQPESRPEATQSGGRAGGQVRGADHRAAAGPGFAADTRECLTCGEACRGNAPEPCRHELRLKESAVMPKKMQAAAARAGPQRDVA